MGIFRPFKFRTVKNNSKNTKTSKDSRAKNALRNTHTTKNDKTVKISKNTTIKKTSKIDVKEVEQKQNNVAPKKEFPTKFPFWARLKIDKKRTTLVIDEAEAYNKKKKRYEEGFVHREAIHPNKDNSNVKGYEKIEPNPDRSDKKPMYLKNPSKLPKVLFKPHNKDLDMPQHLKERYEKNNK